MMNIALIKPNVGNTKLAGSYMKNFSLALVNWELNLQEARPHSKKNRKVSK